MKQISQNKEIWMNSRHFSKVLLTLAIVEIQIKTIVKFYLTPSEWLLSSFQMTINIGMSAGRWAPLSTADMSVN